MLVVATKKEKGHLLRIKFEDFEDVLIDKDVAALKGIKEGTVLSAGELDGILELSDYTRAKSRALWYLDRSDHTEKGLYDKLVKARFSKETSARVIAKLVELGLIDDNRFAKRYAERLFEANTSKRQIYYKLCEKGIGRDLAKETVAQLPEDETEQIKNLIEKKYKSRLKDKESVKKVYASLIRKGFTFSGVKAVLKEYEEELLYTFEDM